MCRLAILLRTEDVRDWFVESSYDFFDPSRERALITIREHERSKGEVICNRNQLIQ